MNIICDTHTHSSFSFDSSTTIESQCYSAIEKGLKIINITDHVDFDNRDDGYGYFDVNGYLNEINECREKFKDKLLLLSGIEFSEPHLYEEEFKKLIKYDFDMVIGSVHWLEEGFIGERSIREKYSREKVETMYYNIVDKALDFGGFDTFAHLDIPKRYYKSSYVFDLDKILYKLIQKNIALEINTSSLRKGLDEYMPSINIVDRYLELGGKKLTIGSDAHSGEELGMGFDKIDDKYYEYIGVYINRQFCDLKSL